MPPSTPIADPHNVLHVYRHLLREISYLPPPARPWATSHAADRFRARPLYRHDVTKDTIVEQKLSDREHSLTLRKRVYKAHGAIWRLRAANSGHAEHMLNILFQAFGRRGRRRRELIEELVYRGGKEAKDSIANGVKPPPPPFIYGGSAATIKPKESKGPKDDIKTDIKATTTTASAIRSKSERRWDWLEKWDTEKLKPYLKSQKAHEGSVNTSWPSTATLRTIDPEKLIPEQNIWQRDWHPKTYRTKLAKGWKHIVDKVQPPIPKNEWDMIRRIALNEDVLDEWKMPPRRKPVPPLSEPTNDEKHNQEWLRWQQLATKPIRHIERPKAPRNIRLSGETDIGPYGRDVKGPASDGRWIRRVFLSLWNTVSVVQKDPSSAKETITWGRKMYRAPPASPVYAELFKGVDAKGIKLPPTT